MASEQDDRVEIIVPADLASQMTTLEDLDSFVKSESDRIGVKTVWVRVPSQLQKFQKLKGAPTTQKVTNSIDALSTKGVAAVGSLGAIAGKSGGLSSKSIGRGRFAWSRRRLILNSLKGGGAVALAVVVGGKFATREAAARVNTCYNCGDCSCYFSSFYGTYVVDCGYWHAACSQGCPCTGRAYHVNCANGCSWNCPNVTCPC